MNEFLENFKKNVRLRTAHSELVGYWSVEFGGRVNKVFHIWKYGMNHQLKYSVQIFILLNVTHDLVLGSVTINTHRLN